MRASAVIGANFGDEGKGLVTDFLSSGDCIVVRFNGGAQAGHTVVTNQYRHVFHHFGSGTLAGASTFLSRFFVVNPFLWEKERDELMTKIGHAPIAYIDPAAPLTTPYDMLINQEIERERVHGNGKHGSCGIGFNETIERNMRGGWSMTTAADLLDLGTLRDKLETVRWKYVPIRLAELGGIVSPQKFFDRLSSSGILESYLVAAAKLREGSEIEIPTLRNCSQVVFEGAQGLQLDEESEFFPHVTRSKTGLRNVLTLASEAGIRQVNVYYVTRPYLTRHGAGPFPTEDKTLNYLDETNVNNEFQGPLRFGRLEPDFIAKAIARDLSESNLSGVSVNPMLAVTHCDQTEEPDSQMLFKLSKACSVSVGLISHGPTRHHVMR